MADPDATTDWADVTACLGGDQRAYARLVSRHQQQIARQMWNFSRNRDVVEELVQEVFVEAYTSLASFRGRAPFLHWIRRIATRVGYRYWKRRKRQRVQLEALMKWQATLPANMDEVAPSAAAEYLHRLLAHLGPEDRLVLTLHYFEQCSMQEIADRIGWNRTLVKVRAFRARRRLKALLESAGFGRSDHANSTTRSREAGGSRPAGSSATR